MPESLRSLAVSWNRRVPWDSFGIRVDFSLGLNHKYSLKMKLQLIKNFQCIEPLEFLKRVHVGPSFPLRVPWNRSASETCLVSTVLEGQHPKPKTLNPKQPSWNTSASETFLVLTVLELLGIL